MKLAEEEEEEAKKAEEEESAEKEEEVWPEPPKRVAPPIRAALVLPDGVAYPEGCKRFSSSGDPDPVVVNKLRYGALAANGLFNVFNNNQLYFLLFNQKNISNHDFNFYVIQKCVVFSTIRENFLKDADDCDELATLSSLIALVEKMEKNEVQSGYYLSPVM